MAYFFLTKLTLETDRVEGLEKPPGTVTFLTGTVHRPAADWLVPAAGVHHQVVPAHLDRARGELRDRERPTVLCAAFGFN